VAGSKIGEKWKQEGLRAGDTLREGNPANPGVWKEDFVRQLLRGSTSKENVGNPWEM